MSEDDAFNSIWSCIEEFSHSPLDEMITGGNVLLEHVLDEDTLLQEVKSMNQTVINYLATLENLTIMVKYLTTTPEEGSDRDVYEHALYKYPYVISEIFACEIETINGMFEKHPILFRNMFDYLRNGDGGNGCSSGSTGANIESLDASGESTDPSNTSNPSNISTPNSCGVGNGAVEMDARANPARSGYVLRAFGILLEKHFVTFANVFMELAKEFESENQNVFSNLLLHHIHLADMENFILQVLGFRLDNLLDHDFTAHMFGLKQISDYGSLSGSHADSVSDQRKSEFKVWATQHGFIERAIETLDTCADNEFVAINIFSIFDHLVYKGDNPLSDHLQSKPIMELLVGTLLKHQKTPLFVRGLDFLLRIIEQNDVNPSDPMPESMATIASFTTAWVQAMTAFHPNVRRTDAKDDTKGGDSNEATEVSETTTSSASPATEPATTTTTASPTTTTTTTTSSPTTPASPLIFDESQLAALQLIRVLFKLKYAEIEPYLVESRAFEEVVGLFFQLEHNNVFHSNAYTIIANALSFNQGEQLVKQSGLIENILESVKLFGQREKKKEDPPSYMGHVVNIANLIVNLQSNRRDFSTWLQDVKGWGKFVRTFLAQQNEIAHMDLGGQRSSISYSFDQSETFSDTSSSDTSSEDDDDEDDFIAQTAKEVFQTTDENQGFGDDDFEASFEA